MGDRAREGEWLAGERRTLQRISQIALAGHPVDEAYQRICGELESAAGFPMSAIVLHDEARGRLVFKGAGGLTAVGDSGDFEVASTRASWAWSYEPGSLWSGPTPTRRRRSSTSACARSDRASSSARP